MRSQYLAKHKGEHWATADRREYRTTAHTRAYMRECEKQRIPQRNIERDGETTRKRRAANIEKYNESRRAQERRYRAMDREKYNEEQKMNKRKRAAARKNTDVNRIMAGVGCIVLSSQLVCMTKNHPS